MLKKDYKYLIRTLGIVLIIFCMFSNTLFVNAKDYVTIEEGINAVSTNTSDKEDKYYSSWEYWSQGASKYDAMREAGCRIVAYSKLIKEAGYAKFSDPDEYFKWGYQNGYFSKGVGELVSIGVPVKKYIEANGGSATSKRIATGKMNKETINNYVMSYLKSGYYVAMFGKLSNGSPHTIYVGRNASLKHGETVLLDSGGDVSYSPKKIYTFRSHDTFKCNSIHVFSIDGSGKDNVIIEETKIKYNSVYAKDITDTSAKVRAEVTADASMYKEAGVYWGVTTSLSESVSFNTSKNTKLTFIEVAFDGTEGPKLSPGVTYYYQFYAKRNDGTIDLDSQVRSFKTTGTENKISYDNVYVKSVTDNTAFIRADVTSDASMYKEAGVYWGTTTALSEKVSFDTSQNKKLTFIEVAFDGSEGPKLNKGTKYYYQFYAIRNDGKIDKDSTVRSFVTTGDNTNPVVEEAYVKDLDHSGYSIVCKVSDNVGVVRIAFPTWTTTNDQDDLVSDWYNNEAILTTGNGTYTYRINTSKHNGEYGNYNTHIYVYDATGNYTIYPIDNIKVPRYMPFLDILPDSWHFNAVANVMSNGYMNGKSEETFDPNSNITRAEVASVIYNMEEKPIISYVRKFTDVPEGEWYTNPIIWAFESSIVSGYGNGKFGVSDNVTREQLAKMLYSYAQFKGYDMSYNENAISSYADSAKVSKWAQPAMNWAISKGIMSGKGNAGADLSTYRLDPLGTATRAECASMINKFSELK